MDLHVSLAGRRDLSGQIYQQIRAAVLDHRLRPGEPLPPSRELARRLEVARNTVGVAYDRLTAEGYVTARIGAGTFVSKHVDPSGGPAASDTPAAGGPLRAREIWSTVPLPTGGAVAHPEFDFRAGLPDARLFPYQAWRRLVARELRASAVGTGMYGEPAGHRGLRAAIARHVGLSRAVLAAPDDVLITNGIQQALDLIGRVLLEPGACVAVEHPGYAPARRLFESLGARIVSVPVDADGLVVDALPTDARAVYVTPSHQFPLGMPMSLARRMALLAWANRHAAVVIEDDYDSEFRYGGRPIEPLHSLDRQGLVLYVGSFSKTMLPTLRMGFLIAPRSLHHPLQAAKYLSDWHAPLANQAALARFIDEGSLARHIRRMRREYEVRHERVAAGLTRELGEWLEMVPSAAGLHLTAVARGGMSEGDLARVLRRAGQHGVGVFPISLFSPGVPTRPGLILGYGAVPAARIAEGLRRLGACFAA